MSSFKRVSFGGESSCGDAVGAAAVRQNSTASQSSWETYSNSSFAAERWFSSVHARVVREF
jgi:hypothetical protein